MSNFQGLMRAIVSMSSAKKNWVIIVIKDVSF